MPENSVADRPVVNLSGYRFVALEGLEALRDALHAALARAGVRGTVLLAGEGVNVALAGTRAQADAARAALGAADPRLAGLRLKESRSATVPFGALKVRLRREIIAFDGEGAAARRGTRPEAPAIGPDELAAWLDAGPAPTLLDTRNAYEVASGTFVGAVHLDLERFTDFGHAVEAAVADGRLDPARPVVTFCTGGVRCEKAAPWLLEHGFGDVRQLEGGVLHWFERLGGARWEGGLFVFDERVELDPALAPTGATLCPRCQCAVPPGAPCGCGAKGDCGGGSDAAAPAQPSRTAIDTV